MHKFTQTNNLWLMKPNSTNSSFHLLGVYFTATTLLSLFLLLTWQKRATTNKEKKQALILFSTLLITFLAATAETFLIPALTSYWSIGLAPLAIGIWISGILYCFIRFKFLSLTPEVIGFQLVNNIKETTILLDNNFTILYYNQACAKLLKQPLREEAKKPIQTIITEWQKIKPEIEEINANHSGSFSCRVHLINSKQETILIDARFSIIKDKFHDPLGIMIIAEEVKEALQLKQLYKITIRELDIIQLLMEGSSTKQIATQLTISERTVKTHLTSIYNKTEVENKIQLFNLLHRFNLFPEHTADKRLLIIPQKEAN